MRKLEEVRDISRYRNLIFKGHKDYVLFSNNK